jgi:REase_DpnII-MboI/Uncharacterized protein conserved in bacteria (DUF2321)
MTHASALAGSPDVMQVCKNGHVVTDLLRACPERGSVHCDRCGAPTLDHCLTCGRNIPGAVNVPGLAPAGSHPPPNYCATCGAPFPWTSRPDPTEPACRARLEAMLRRLPRAIAQLRSRHGDRPVFSVNDEHDLEDLLRAVLALHFDDVRPECRTPRYAVATRTDFLLARDQTSVTAKLARPEARVPQLAEQLREDIAYYQARGNCACLVGFVYDPQGLLPDPTVLERAWSESGDVLEVGCVIAG